jgi:L-Ala-D/L-Glu epimerase
VTTPEAARPPNDDLTIEAVGYRVARQPLRAPFRTALRELTEIEVVEVGLTWSNGLVTTASVSPAPPITGETTGSICAAMSGPLADAVRGVPLSHHEELFRRLHRAIRANTTAKCAIDLAVHTALALPWKGAAAFLGAAAGPVRTDVTVSLAPAESMAGEAARRAQEGFDVLKLKVGTEDVGADVARIAAVARAVGPDVVLRLDANQGWTAKQALAVLDGLERMGIRPELVEQPVAAHDLAGLAAVARHGFVPVMADESVHSATDVLRLAELGAADLVNVKLAKCGGLRAARDVISTAQACGLEVLIGCMLEPASTVAAAATLALTLPAGRGHDLDAAWWLAPDGSLSYQPPWVVVTNNGPSSSRLGATSSGAARPT